MLAVPEENNKRTEEMTLPIKQLSLAQYQRGLQSKTVTYIVTHYDPKVMLPIEVSARDGLYLVLDGQHRIAALTQLGIKTVRAHVHFGMTESEEAEFFAAQNGYGTSVARSIENAHAALIAGDPVVREINDIVESEGLRIAWDGKQRFGCVTKWVPLEQAYRKYGARNLAMTLRVMHQSFGGDPKAYLSYSIAALSKMLDPCDHDPNLKSATLLVRALHREGYKRLYQQAKDLAAQTRSKLADAARVVFIDAYNYRKPVDKRLSKFL